MQDDFPSNRYDFSQLIAQLQMATTLSDVTTDTETGIEFYNKNSLSKEDFIEFLKEFNVFDNMAQSMLKNQYEENKQMDVKNYLFEPSWVDLSSEKVIVGYYGVQVNSDFDLTFMKSNDTWVLS